MNQLRRIHIILVAWILSANLSVNAQISPNQFDQLYLEHLVKIKIDSVRQSKGLSYLVNDSLLYVASLHHANYMQQQKLLTHFEDGKKETYSPQLRAEYYGARNYQVGENVIRSQVNRTIKGKDGKTFNTSTYEGLANSIVNGWVNSPGHYKNIITPEYQVTGVSAKIDTFGNVYVCQKFAIVNYKYAFTESPSLFPYSAYKPVPLASSFAGIDQKLIAGYAYAWGLTHDYEDHCQSCNDLINHQPYTTLRIEDGWFILRVENSEYIANLIQDKYDGFAVEIVTFDDYMCGNPAYYTLPSRRNGQLKTNGKILKPLYRDDLIRGYKNRKRNPSVKFVDYIFNAKHIRFVNRFAHYKVEKYSSEYFEIRLGKVPSNIKGMWAHNLLYIQQKQICHVDYFTGYCGEIFTDSVTAEFIPPDTASNYVFELDKKKVDFVIPFEQGQFSFSEEQITPYLESVNDLHYLVDSIHVHAWSSVEGDSLINQRLQIKRAESIVAILLKNQLNEVPVMIETSTAWDEFRRDVRTSKTWSYLAAKNPDEIQNALQGQALVELEPMLAKQRRANVIMYCTIPFEDKNLEYYIKRDLDKISREMQKIQKTGGNSDAWLYVFEELYRYVYKRVADGRLTPDYLAAIKLPANYQKEPRLVEDFCLYGHTYEKAFAKNKLWVQNHYSDRKLATTKYLPLASDNMVYNDSYFDSEQIRRGKLLINLENMQKLLNNLGYLENYYAQSSVAHENIENITFNMNCVMLSGLLNQNPQEYKEDARTCIYQIYLFYESRGRYDKTAALKLAKASVFFSANQDAIDYLAPFFDDEEVMAYALPLMYQHPDDPGAESFYNLLLEQAQKMTSKTWCNLFMADCMIPFQAFDHEALRDVFCEKCLSENEYLKDVLQ